MHFGIQIFRQQIGSNYIRRFEKSAGNIQVVYWWMEVLSKNRGFEKKGFHCISTSLEVNFNLGHFWGQYDLFYLLLEVARECHSAIAHFGVPLGPCFKTRVGAQPLMWKLFFILMQIKLIFTRKVVHLASFWKWGFLELRSGLFETDQKDAKN